jgi:DNA-binding CsgD family transcriptional regulator
VNLVERDEQLALLDGYWTRAKSGRGSVMLVGGEAGIGKTSLLRAFVGRATGRTRQVWGSCTPLSAPPPLEPLREMAPDLGGGLTMLLADGAPLHDVARALMQELTATPFVVVIDDLHWADEATIDLLRVLVRRIGGSRSLVLGTYRDDEIPLDHPLLALLGDVARSADGAQLRLPALSRDGVAWLVGDRELDPDELVTLTAGNPFFLREVLSSDGQALPTSIRSAVLARTAELPPEAHAVLALLACAPESVPDVVLPALDIDLPTLRALDATGLLERGARGLRFRHELCRRAIVDVIPPGGEVALHRRVLLALEERDADPAILTHHAIGAHDAQRIVRFAPEAARRAAASGAHREAARLYEAALAQRPMLSDEAHVALLEALATELYLTDRVPDAIAAAERARALREQQDDVNALGSLHQRMAMYEWYNADRVAADHHAATAVELLGPDGDPWTAGHAYATDAYLALQSCDVDRVDALLARAEPFAVAADDPALRLRLNVIRAGRAVLAGEVDARQALLRAAADGFRASLDEPASSGCSNLAYLDVEQRRFVAAGDLLATSLPLTIERDLPICHVWQLGARGRMRLLTGEWDMAIQDANRVLDSRGAQLGRTWPELVRGLIALRRGEADASVHLDAAWELAMRFGEPLRVLPSAAALAEQAWITGTADARLGVAEDWTRQLTNTVGLEWSLGDFAVWLQRLGRPPVAAGATVAEPYRLQLAGDAAAAARFWRAAGQPFDEALALAETGSDADAFDALRILDGLGAEPVGSRIRQQLRARGVAGVPVGPRASTRKNPAGLTARQLEVLALVAEGLTNTEVGERLFISRKTVDHHLSAILAKLGATSRTEAAHLAHKRQLLA